MAKETDEDRYGAGLPSLAAELASVSTARPMRRAHMTSASAPMTARGAGARNAAALHVEQCAAAVARAVSAAPSDDDRESSDTASPEHRERQSRIASRRSHWSCAWATCGGTPSSRTTKALARGAQSAGEDLVCQQVVRAVAGEAMLQLAQASVAGIGPRGPEEIVIIEPARILVVEGDPDSVRESNGDMAEIRP